MTMLKKNFFSAAEAYAAPVCETLDVRFESVLQASDGTWNNSIKQGSTWNNNETDYGLE